MSQHSELFGYFFIGGSPSQTPFVLQSLEFNREAITRLPDDSFWSPDDFRFASYDKERDNLRTIQTIAVAKFTLYREHETILTDLLAALALLHWSDGYLVNRSIDRSIVQEPLSYEYDFRCEAFSVQEVKPAGQAIEVSRIVRPWDSD